MKGRGEAHVETIDFILKKDHRSDKSRGGQNRSRNLRLLKRSMNANNGLTSARAHTHTHAVFNSICTLVHWVALLIQYCRFKARSVSFPVPTLIDVSVIAICNMTTPYRENQMPARFLNSPSRTIRALRASGDVMKLCK